ncbi:MAG: hypothetical protein ACR2M8_10845 [Pyrinomonadaceae bacterium]|nr:hypothetical protein [Acidobacteriota bacterium]
MLTNQIQNGGDGGTYQSAIRAQAVNAEEPGENSIKRNVRPVTTSSQATDIYNRARQIYFRARRSNRSRALSIL